MPEGLAADVAGVWGELYPHAIAEGQLTARTVVAFTILCRLVAAERVIAQSPAAFGPDHRGVLQRIESGMLRFRLFPDGKPVERDEPVDEWTQFDVIQGGKV